MINDRILEDLFTPSRERDRDRLLVGTGATAPLPDVTFRWGTVDQVEPMEVLLDGDEETMPVGANCLVADPTVGMRVWCQLWGRRLIVLGTPGGSSGTRTAVGTVEITGSNAGQTSATITFPAGRFPPGSTPIVTATPVSTSPQTNQVSVSAATNTSVTIYLFRNATSALIPINWNATLGAAA